MIAVAYTFEGLSVAYHVRGDERLNEPVAAVTSFEDWFDATGSSIFDAMSLTRPEYTMYGLWINVFSMPLKYNLLRTFHLPEIIHRLHLLINVLCIILYRMLCVISD